MCSGRGPAGQLSSRSPTTGSTALCLCLSGIRPASKLGDYSILSPVTFSNPRNPRNLYLW